MLEEVVVALLEEVVVAVLEEGAAVEEVEEVAVAHRLLLFSKRGKRL